MFISGQSYSKRDLYGILEVPLELQKGNWNTGYTTYRGKVYIFCNIGVPGRTGHNYDNHWEHDYLIWFGKTNSNKSQASTKLLLDQNTEVYIFTRTNSSQPFYFQGMGKAKTFKDITPIEITWEIVQVSTVNPTILPEEVFKPLIEGRTIAIEVNKYERNREARQTCIEYYGNYCQICKFDFGMQYGKAGESFIHVHHLKELSQIRSEYIIDPIKDLIPVCPNCHAMLHRRIPCYTPADIKLFLKLNEKNQVKSVGKTSLD